MVEEKTTVTAISVEMLNRVREHVEKTSPKYANMRHFIDIACDNQLRRDDDTNTKTTE